MIYSLDGIAPEIDPSAWVAPDANLTMEEVIVDRYREDEQGDWRTWNLSRSRAGYLAETYTSPGGIAAEARAAQAPEVNSR